MTVTINWMFGLIMNLSIALIIGVMATVMISVSLETGYHLLLWMGLFQVVCTIYLLAVTFNIGEYWTNDMVLSYNR